MELELGKLYLRIGGLSGTLNTNVVRCFLNRSRVSHFRMCPGIQFHILGPMIANEFSWRLLCLILQPLCRGGTLAVYSRGSGYLLFWMDSTEENSTRDGSEPMICTIL